MYNKGRDIGISTILYKGKYDKSCTGTSHKYIGQKIDSKTRTTTYNRHIESLNMMVYPHS